MKPSHDRPLWRHVLFLLALLLLFVLLLKYPPQHGPEIFREPPPSDR
jgi:hypothetical protein